MNSNHRRALAGALLALTCAAPFVSAENGSQTNFQIAPPPIPYPYFVEGKGDGNVQALAGSMSMPGASLGFGGAAGALRYSFNHLLAVDVAGSLAGGAGQFTSGLIPFTPIPGFIPFSNGSANLSTFMGGFSGDAELQVIGTRDFSLILFGGPTIQVMNFTATSPYGLMRISDGALFYGYTDKLTLTGALGGVQGGLQAGIKLGKAVKLAPFFTMTSVSGSVTLEDNPGIKGRGVTSMTLDVPTQTTTAGGLDIIYMPLGLSLGTMLQQVKSDSSNSNGNVKTVMFQVGWRFGNPDKNMEEDAARHESTSRPRDGLYRPRI